MNNIFGPNRQSIRLKGFDYASTGAYFVTICTHKRLPIFGEIQNDQMHLSPVGKMIQTAWNGIIQYDPRIALDDFMVMPNHFHGIVLIDELNGVRGCDCVPGCNCGREFDCGRGQCPAPTITLSSIIGRFKSWTTHHYGRGRLWQRNYFERIIRNDRELETVREYIRNNPMNWAHDSKNTKKITPPEVIASGGGLY